MTDFHVRSDHSPIERAVVVVPAHNEEVLLPRCLAALEVAAEAVGADVEIIVVLDACTDASWQAVPAHVSSLTCSARSVGAARRAGFGYAAHPDRARAHSEQTTWYATTDADSEVPPDWLRSQLEAAAEGVDAFVGTVVPVGWDDWPSSVAGLFADRYRADDNHHHVHGANLGFRADAYRRIGGFAPRTGDEDVDIVRRLMASGARVRRSGRSPVATSTRRDGRTDAGFAGYLQGLEILCRRSTHDRRLHDRHPADRHPHDSEVAR
ncbi:glycosyltransferase [Gordonia sp. HNM0687]|uniref:4,4'-diaponeurosporenoate glycosyltransferase n=1 Tax=Gordonia mangrovi TaxID=2665643 RepID=A0A6L7GNR0_9ACTN|nr:glycosyltransferase family 2 protein [Gordonia mangrovi]MXP21559.1 glycosyltransferase [Gordonia mangrovi]UVF80302.1 glycosyltransferase family 2 protein [Gordonia mangrovi]